MSSSPPVSVIIPSYNGERFVAEAAGSVLRQTWRDLELIVVDDGSTDGTRQILRAMAVADPRMRLIEKPNEGLIATLGRGIAEARGTFIARLDHDDVSLPTRIERQLAFLQSHPDHVAVGCLLQNIDADGAPLGTVRIRQQRLSHRPDAFPPRQAWLYGPTPMIRADALRQSGGYRQQFLAAEDRDLCWRLGAMGPVQRLPEVLVQHRLHGGNMSDRAARTQAYSALLADLSAIAAHFRLDDRNLLAAIDVGGDYHPVITGYRRLLAPHYPVDSYLLYYQMRAELWEMPGQPDRAGMPGALLRHLAQRPFDPVRYSLLRRAVTYLSRPPRGTGGHRAASP